MLDVDSRTKANERKPKITRFEELIAWQKARSLTKAIYVISAKTQFARDRSLQDQIRRGAVSIMSNIAEGFERVGRAEFHQFLVIAKASCAEVRSQLYVARDVGYVTSVEFDELSKTALDVSRLIGALRAAVQKQRDRTK